MWSNYYQISLTATCLSHPQGPRVKFTGLRVGGRGPGDVYGIAKVLTIQAVSFLPGLLAAIGNPSAFTQRGEFILAEVQLMRAFKVTVRTGIFLVAAALLTGSLVARQGVSGRDSSAGFGRPETITGTIVMVDASRGVIVLSDTVSAPASTEVTTAQTTAPDGTRVEAQTVSRAPGQVDYKFKVRRSVPITLGGQRVGLADLTSMTGRQATVRCVPERSGNYVLGIEVSR